MAFTFKNKAQKSKAKLRMAIMGPTGSGKTVSALAIASALGDNVAVIDTEGGDTGSANKYADLYDFFHETMSTYHPQLFIDGIKGAEQCGIDVLIIDSLSHAWAGEGGILDIADQVAKRMRSSNSFAAWKEATPIHRALIDAILRSNMHIICTMRTKMEYVLEEQTNKKGYTTRVPKRVGMAPVQRDDMAYEFDIVGDMDRGEMCITKTRMFVLADKVIKHPGKELGGLIKSWLEDGVEVPEAVAPVVPEEEPEPRTASTMTPAERAERVEEALKEPKEAPGSTEPEAPADPAPAEFKYKALVEKAKANGGEPAWNEHLARRLGFARSSLNEHFESSGFQVTFGVEDTRAFLTDNFGLSSHKEMTEAQSEALFEWLRECFSAGRILRD